MSNLETVLKFIEAMKSNEKETILSFFDDNSVFNNVPLGSVTGIKGIWSVLGPLHRQAVSVEYVIHNIAESESGIVLTERTDRYQLKDRMSEFPVMGVFEVKDGVIRQWRDYFDMQQCLEQLPENIELPI
jgi:limonene-1,2-epoxide hydrolase